LDKRGLWLTLYLKKMTVLSLHFFFFSGWPVTITSPHQPPLLYEPAEMD